MSSLKDFQAAHGATWSHLLGDSAFGAALALANQEKIQTILILSDDEIATRATVILADLRGHLRYEAGLLSLHEKKELVFQQLDHEEYPDPILEAAEEAEQHGDTDERIAESSAHIVMSGPTVHEQIFPATRTRRKKKLLPKRKPRKIRK